jgi:hypothetical protein
MSMDASLSMPMKESVPWLHRTTQTLKLTANEQTLPERKIETYISGISSNTSWACSPPATGAAPVVALIAASEPFFVGALFTTGNFVAGYFGCCLGIGGVFATGQTGRVDGAPAISPTANASHELGSKAARKRVERALKCPSRQRLARVGDRLGLPFQPPQVQVEAARMAAPPLFAGQRRMGGLVRAFF